jgi:type II secretory pathway pseudopilin PulG
MIDTKLLRRWRAPSGLLGRSHARREGSAGDRRGLAGEEGLTLIEVMVSALMVGFIAIATFNGLTVATDATASERFHDQADLLAAQSQESLRSDSAATLDAIEESAHTYTQTIGGETYTISQSDRWVQDANQNASCSATGKEHSNAAGNYLQVHTRVTWPQQLASGEHALEQYSIITPPDGSGLEVDVSNGLIPEQPVAGVTVRAGEAESTTGEAGCVIFGGIPATRVNVEAFKVGDVTQTGAIKKDFPELLVVPNLTTQVPVTLNQGAAITAEFTHEGKAATGDTFVASNAKLEPSPDFELGSTRFGTFGKEGEYEALPGEIEATPGKSYAATATTPISTVYYPSGDLFPYEGAWTVYAGDCAENSPEAVDTSQFPKGSNPSVSLTPGGDPTVKVPTSEVTLDVYKTTKAAGGGGLESVLRPVKITNTACASSKTPDNASSFSTIHRQDTTTTGHLEAPYQPFGKAFTLCLWDKETQRTYTTTYGDEAIAGPTLEVYLGEEIKYVDGHGHTIEVKKLQSSNTC